MNRFKYISGEPKPKAEIRIGTQWRGIRCSANPMLIYILKKCKTGDFIVIGQGEVNHIILSGNEIRDRYFPDQGQWDE